MTSRRALIIAPLYDGKWLSPLVGGATLVPQLTACLKGHGGYEIQTLTGKVEPPDFREALSTFFDSDGERLLYFYGHGCLSTAGLGVFATSSAQPNDEGVFMFEVTSLAVTTSAQEVVLIFDCCHAGAANEVTDLAIAGLADQVTKSNGKNQGGSNGRMLLAGCASHQSGWEVQADEEQKKIGAFSYHVLKGLEGEARSKRGEVRASLLGAYVTDTFNSWNQIPIARHSEGGNRRCVITSGFPEDSQVGSTHIDEVRETRIIGTPFKPSQHFVGRSAEIEELLNMLELGDRQVAISATIEGLGGIGKTELVIQLIYQQEVQATYNTIIWIDGAGPLPPQWEKIATELGVSNPSSEPEALVNGISQELRKQGNSLIILDNASEWGPVAQLIPKDIALLVTTRTQGFGGLSFHHMELRVLSDEAAKNFLLQMVPELEHDRSLDQLVEALQGHALALELAGWNIKYMGLSASEYIRRLNNHKCDLDRAVSATKYGKAVDACLALTWNNLKYDSARTLWRRASLFAPASAHRNLLEISFTGTGSSRESIEWMIEEEYYSSEQSESDLRNLLGNSEDFYEAYAELREFHVLTRVEGSNSERWAMHRLVRDYGRARLKRGEVAFHAMSLSDWLNDPTLPLEPEIPHLVSTIMDAARYVGEFRDLRGSRSLGREIGSKGIWGRGGLTFNAAEFIYFIQEQLKDPKALNMILEGLTDIDENVRVQSIRLLENVGPIPEVLEGLASSLDDPDPQVREMAGRTLAEHGSDKTISILRAAVYAPAQRGSLTAVKALGLMGKKAHEALVESLECSHKGSRLEAALLLSEQGQKEGIQLLIEEIQSVPEKDQSRFIDALGITKDSKAIPVIIKFLDQPKHRESAIYALGKIGDVSVYSKIIPFMVSEGDYGPGDAAKKVLVAESKYLSLKDALQHEEAAVRIKAALLLCEVGESIGSKTIVNEFESITEDKKIRFIRALGTAKDPVAIPVITKFLLNSHGKNSFIAAEAILIILGHKNDIPEEVFNTFTGLLSSSDSWETRQESAKYLGKYKYDNAVPELIEALKDSDYDVRREVATALGLIGDSRSADRLAEVANSDSDSNVKKAAKKALKQVQKG